MSSRPTPAPILRHKGAPPYFLPELITQNPVRAQGVVLGLQGDALDLYVRQTAPARHEARVQYVVALLLNEAAAICERVDPVENSAAALFLVALEQQGIGGRFNAGGTGTARIPALTSCGKGRKLANDGPAWCAAVRGAVSELYENVAGDSYSFAIVDYGANVVGAEVRVSLRPGAPGGCGQIAAALLPWDRLIAAGYANWINAYAAARLLETTRGIGIATAGAWGAAYNLIRNFAPPAWPPAPQTEEDVELGRAAPPDADDDPGRARPASDALTENTDDRW